MEEEKAPLLMSEEEAPMVMSEEDRFRSMAEEGLDRSFDENLPIFRSEITTSLGEMEIQMESPPNKREHPLVFAKLDWAEGLEDSIVNVIKYMSADRDYCRRGAAHFADKEPALAETLRGKAAWSDATLAQLVEIAASAHRLRGMCLRTVAELEEVEIVCVAAAEYLAHVATYMTHDGDSIPDFPYRAVADQVLAEVAAGARVPALELFVEAFAERAGRLTRGAVELGGQDAVNLQKRAEEVEKLCADTEAFLQQIVASPYWRMWKCFFM